MKIWLEALTGKQALLIHHLALGLEEDGHNVIITTRKYDYTESNLDRLDREYISVGEYGGASLKNKLIAGSERIIELAEIIDEHEPDILISFPSPDAHRAAFGMGLPIIQLNDTPHARAVARLTISLTNYLVHPSAIDKKEFMEYGVTEFIDYEGIDEILWTKNFNPSEDVLKQLDLEKENYVVLRCEESKAAYFQKMYPDHAPGKTILIEIIETIRKVQPELKFVAFPRYEEQKIQLEKSNVIIPDVSIDTLSLLAFARLVITGGGTMAREAALLGTQTIYYFPIKLAVSDFIKEQGFPIHHLPKILNEDKIIRKLLSSPNMKEEKRKKLINQMETPLTKVREVFNKIFPEGKI